jgi:hypothetical protein
MSRYESLRASDADRDAATERLRQAAGEGRLEPDELEERVDAALRARTYGELARLVADLPDRPDAAGVPPRSQARVLARSALLGTGALVTVTLALALIALVAMLVLAAVALTAAWWIGCVLFWLVCCGSRRRLVSSFEWRHRTQVHRTRPAGLSSRAAD